MQVNGARAIHSAWGPHGPSSTSRPAFLPLVCASGSTPYLTPAPGRRKWRKQTIIPGEDEPKWAVSLNISAPLLPVSWNFSSDLWVGNGLPLWGISVCVCVCVTECVYQEHPSFCFCGLMTMTHIRTVRLPWPERPVPQQVMPAPKAAASTRTL